MRRALATSGTLLLLALPLAGCGDEDSPASADTPTSETATASPSALTDLPRALPAVPSAEPSGSLPSGVEFDACVAVPPDLLLEHFGIQAGRGLPQAASFGDPAAADCYYFSNDVVMVMEATTRADEDMPETGYSYEGLPGAVPIPGADRGWAIIFPGQDGASTVVSGLILVKGDKGLNFSISITGHPYDAETLVAFAQDVLTSMA
jgi:hypothetical protein